MSLNKFTDISTKKEWMNVNCNKIECNELEALEVKINEITADTIKSSSIEIKTPFTPYESLQNLVITSENNNNYRLIKNTLSSYKYNGYTLANYQFLNGNTPIYNVLDIVGIVGSPILSTATNASYVVEIIGNSSSANLANGIYNFKVLLGTTVISNNIALGFVPTLITTDFKIRFIINTLNDFGTLSSNIQCINDVSISLSNGTTIFGVGNNSVVLDTSTALLRTVSIRLDGQSLGGDSVVNIFNRSINCIGSQIY